MWWVTRPEQAAPQLAIPSLRSPPAAALYAGLRRARAPCGPPDSQISDPPTCLHLQLNLLRVTSNKTVFFLQSAGGEAVSENKLLNTDSSTGSVETTAKPLPFKDPNFIHSGIGGAAAGKKNRTWKNLKQILASERALPWQLNDPSYFNIDAPPSFKPAKKYSDISGLPANYTDPQSKLRFSTIEEFAYIRMLPSDVVTGYLALRKATSIVS
ncbi:INO80 complex subunit C [Geospiza fortis]|uniref:INO80 complex subunit C n=1 Tax=Geospiza fortis TaxID=48883 RepID=A0A8N5EG71_GEOFO|nr:INO80 complex subunit C [Geospiza fortis]